MGYKKNTAISIYELMQLFPNEESARVYLEGRRWKESVECPCCGSLNIYKRKGKRKGMYDCRECKKHFSVRTGSVFEKSKIPLNKWIYAIYAVMTSRKGISSIQLSKEIGVTYKTAWFMAHRIREACGGDSKMLSGVVEVDETYIGGKEHNKHSHKKPRAGRGAVGKQAVLGMRERKGRVKMYPIASTDQFTLQDAIFSNVAVRSTIYTDEHGGYKGLPPLLYDHESVRYSAKEYVNGMAHTNGIESVWAVLKRGQNGTYHHVSTKHLGRYVDEFAFRLNEGNCERETMDRVNSLAMLLPVSVSPIRRLTQ